MTNPTDWTRRRLHFVGIGGAGMSGLALIARALGASVTGSDRTESSYIARLRAHGIEPVIGHAAANIPAGAEVVYSTAVAPENPERQAAAGPELHRADLMAEIAALRRCLAVTGTHGKTTTAGMIVHVLRACGMDPSYLIGGELCETDSNAGWGTGEWIVVEADESDRSLLKLDPEIAVLTNAELDHHATYASRLDLEATLRTFMARAGARAVVWNRAPLRALCRPDAVAYDAPDAILEPGGVRFRWRDFDVSLGIAGAHNAINAAGALTASALAGADPACAAAKIGGYGGARRRFELLGSTAAGVPVYDDYAHHPTEVAATIEAARTLAPRRLVAVFQPHLYSRTRALAREFGAALAGADVVLVLDVYPARERAEDYPGVDGRLVAAAAADGGGGGEVAWLPGFDDARAYLQARLRPGDLCLVMGAGDVDALARSLINMGEGAVHARPPAAAHAPPLGRPHAAGRSRLPEGVQRDYPLARLTTVRTGGPAELFARAGTVSELEALLAWAGEHGLEVGVVGSGSNLLVADDGVRGLVLKLERELSKIERHGTRIECGGGARLPAVSAQAARAGLTGIEFGVNIPGSVGGAVRMNANAYGGELARALEWVDVVSAAGTERRRPEELGFRYRASNLRAGEVVARAAFALSEASAEEVKQTLAEMRSWRREAQPSGIKTFGSTFKNPDDPRAEGRSAGQLLDAAGCRGLRVGGASFSEKHANFVENHGDATTADVIALMAEGRRRVRERFGVDLEPEVQALGPVTFPEDWGPR